APDAAHATAVLTTEVAPHGAGAPAPGPEPAEPFDQVDWDASGAADSCADRMTERAEAADPALRDRILWRVVLTPADLERGTGVPGGVVAPPVLAGADGAYLAPATEGRLPGAYRVGGEAHPGGGLIHAGMSGALAAGLIVEGPGWRGSY
ncbi:hypothetical protein HCJ92_24045, partial [Streptomyces sp. ventii]|nr:hypothetical protein [Streptomyces spiramenti]